MAGTAEPAASGSAHLATLPEVLAQWGRLGAIGFGGPPTHLTLLRRLCVDERAWIGHDEFEDAIAAVNLLPGPASTQLAIYCAWRVRGWLGGLAGGLGFIVPGLVVITALAAVVLAPHPPPAVAGAAAGAGAVVPAVALGAALALLAPSWRRATTLPRRVRWVLYALAGAVSAATLGVWLAAVLLACGLLEVGARRPRPPRALPMAAVPLVALAMGGLGALAWSALKVGALSFGGGFVIVPLLQADAVRHDHWMTSAQFLAAVALGQVTPGPVVLTVAVVGYAAGGLGGALFATALAFAPSFCFVLLGAAHFDALRSTRVAGAFLAGAGPAAVGAIAGAALPLGLALGHLWQVGVLAAALVWVVLLRRHPVPALVAGAVLGAVLAPLGLPLH